MSATDADIFPCVPTDNLPLKDLYVTTYIAENRSAVFT